MPTNIVWCALGKLVVENWLVIKIVQSIYMNARSCVIVNGNFSDDFLVQVGLPQGSQC